MRSLSRLSVILALLAAGMATANRKTSWGALAPKDHSTAQLAASKLPNPDVEVIFRCDKLKASLADSVSIEVAILNVGEKDAYLYDRLEWGEGGGLLLWFNDGEMERFRPWVDPPLPPPPPDDPNLFVRLENGHFYGLQEKWSVKNLGRGRPGKFKLWVEYTSPVLRGNVSNRNPNQGPIPAWFEYIPVKSNSLEFEILP